MAHMKQTLCQICKKPITVVVSAQHPWPLSLCPTCMPKERPKNDYKQAGCNRGYATPIGAHLLWFLLFLCLAGCGARLPIGTPAQRPAAPCRVLRMVYAKGPLRSSGSCFAVRWHGKDVILTALHIQAPGYTPCFHDEQDRPVPCRILRTYAFTEWDGLAFVVEDLPARVYRWPVGHVDFGSVAVEGYARGNMTRRTGALGCITVESTCQIVQGMSGAPLIQHGKAVGILRGYIQVKREKQIVRDGSDYSCLPTLLQAIK